jgi:hypothetical protein
MNENEFVSLDDVVQVARADYAADPSPEKLKALTALEKELIQEKIAEKDREQRTKDADLDRQARADIEAAHLDAEATQAEADREQRDKQNKSTVLCSIVSVVCGLVGSLAGIGLAVLANSRDNRLGLEEQAYEFDTAARLEKEEDVIFRTNSSRNRYKHKVHNVPVKK